MRKLLFHSSVISGSLWWLFDIIIGGAIVWSILRVVAYFCI